MAVSLLDHYAAHAMSAIITKHGFDWSAKEIAHEAFIISLAMIAAKGNNPGKQIDEDSLPEGFRCH